MFTEWEINPTSLGEGLGARGLVQAPYRGKSPGKFLGYCLNASGDEELTTSLSSRIISRD